MTFMEIVVWAWVCDACGLEALSPNDGMPEAWTFSHDGERHCCPTCVPAHLRSVS